MEKMSSRLCILLAVVIFNTSFASATRRPCDSKGKCKFGGTCMPDNTCSCSFTCSKPTWAINRNTIYCNTETGGKPFLNICYLMARACEIQRNLPLIKMDFKKPKSRRCQVKDTERWHLCPKAEDFMGPCGGTLDPTGSLVDAGVCLKDQKTNRTRCECPNSRFGEDCQAKMVLLAAMKSDEKDEMENSSQLAIVVAISSTAGVVLGIIIFASLRFRGNAKRTEGRDHSQSAASDLIVKESKVSATSLKMENNNRSDASLKAKSTQEYENSSTKTKGSYVIQIDAEINTVTPTVFETSAANASSSRRQRLNGFSAHKPLTEDKNNNHSPTQDSKEILSTTPLVQKVASTPAILTKDNQSRSAPVMAFINASPRDNNFQGASEHSQLCKDAYTL